MFYHSFPRPKHGQDSIKKGLSILDSFLKNGFLMVPENITYKRGKADKNSLPPEYRITQNRFCLTQIDISELKAHEKHFGCFHLEFMNQKTYALGATPVFYLPDSDPDNTEWPLKTLAAGYLSGLFEIQSIIEYIMLMDKKLEGMKDGERMPIAGKNNSIEVRQLRGVFEMVTQKLRPQGDREILHDDIKKLMDHLLGVLQGVSFLFYPTDKDLEGDFDELYYFRQREWRICAGARVEGQALYRRLTKDEKTAFIEQDKSFFEKEIVYATGEKLRRVDECYFMTNAAHKDKQKNDIELIPVRQFVERIIVPKEALKDATAIADQYGFARSRIVDFESAMELAICESEYEVVKTQCRIQMLKAACIGC